MSHIHILSFFLFLHIHRIYAIYANYIYLREKKIFGEKSGPVKWWRYQAGDGDGKDDDDDGGVERNGMSKRWKSGRRGECQTDRAQLNTEEHFVEILFCNRFFLSFFFFF